MAVSFLWLAVGVLEIVLAIHFAPEYDQDGHLSRHSYIGDSFILAVGSINLLGL